MTKVANKVLEALKESGLGTIVLEGNKIDWRGSCVELRLPR